MYPSFRSKRGVQVSSHSFFFLFFFAFYRVARDASREEVVMLIWDDEMGWKGSW